MKDERERERERERRKHKKNNSSFGIIKKFYNEENCSSRDIQFLRLTL
jgi:hypothetical protein